MYTEDRPKRGQFLKQFIMKLILIIIFVLLLIWLVPWPNMDSYMNALNPLKDQIFNSNLQTMKDAGISYFTSERLPENVGDKTTLTLQKMLDMKLLIPFTDRNGNSCDVTKSYVSLEKKETEYVMKVNLKCGDEEDYILVHLGCYSYCDSAICEKQPEKTEKPSTTPKQVVKDNITTQKPTVKPTSNPTNTPTYVPKYTCKYVNGQYWGRNSVVVSQATYEDECVSKPTPTPVAEKEYEYKKETSTYHLAEYSQWSSWKKSIIQEGQVIQFGLFENGTKEVQDLGMQKVGTQDAVLDTVLAAKPYQKQIGTTKLSVCKDYEYVIETITTVTYTETITETVTTPGYYITDGGQQLVQVNGDWSWSDHWYKGYTPPQDTASSNWKFVGTKTDNCEGSCTNHQVPVYRERTRSTTTYPVDSSVISANNGGSSSSSSTSANTSVTEKIISSGCANIVEKEVPIYGTFVKVEKNTVVLEPAKDIYRHVYQVRTRELLKDEYTDIRIDYKWSSYGDTTLLNAGYNYTGKTRNK